jgi:hypothetical protein
MRLIVFAASFLFISSCAAGGQTTDTGTEQPPDMPLDDAAAPDVDEEGEPRACTGNEDCDDGIDCTQDICGVDGTCRHVADDSRCEGDQRCDTTLGCTSDSCDSDDDCDDGVFCNGRERCYEHECWPGEERTCDDGNPCTNDFCNAAADRCVNEWIAGCETDVETDGDVPDPFDPLVHFDGTFRLWPIVSSDCGSCSYTIEFIEFSRTDTELSVQAGSLLLLQSPVPEGPAFRAVREGANAIYQLQATFYNADEFGGTWTASFSGACSICSPQSIEVYGVRR